MGPRHSSPGTTLAAGILLVLLSVMAVTVMMHRFRFERTLLALTEARLGFLAADMGRRIQAGLDLGLDLPALTGVGPILEDELRRDPRIAGIELRDVAGRLVLVRRPDGAAGEVAPPAPAGTAPGSASGTPVWLDSGPALIAAGAGLSDLFGQPAGSVVLLYPRAAVEGVANRLALRLTAVALLPLLLAGGLLGLAARRRRRGAVAGPQA